MVDPVGGAGSEIAVQLGQLSDLFRRRLLEDRTMRQAFEQQQTRIGQLEREVSGEWLRPMLKSLGMAIDRARVHADAAGFGASIADELMAAVADYGIEAISSVEEFDPLVHEVVGTDPESGCARVVSVGFRKGGRTLVPARVVLGAKTAAG